MPIVGKQILHTHEPSNPSSIASFAASRARRSSSTNDEFRKLQSEAFHAQFGFRALGQVLSGISTQGVAGMGHQEAEGGSGGGPEKDLSKGFDSSRNNNGNDGMACFHQFYRQQQHLPSTLPSLPSSPPHVHVYPPMTSPLQQPSWMRVRVKEAISGKDRRPLSATAKSAVNQVGKRQGKYHALLRPHSAPLQRRSISNDDDFQDSDLASRIDIEKMNSDKQYDESENASPPAPPTRSSPSLHSMGERARELRSREDGGPSRFHPVLTMRRWTKGTLLSLYPEQEGADDYGENEEKLKERADTVTMRKREEKWIEQRRGAIIMRTISSSSLRPVDTRATSISSSGKSTREAEARKRKVTRG